jgi:autotransporter-associated beta strand protein
LWYGLLLAAPAWAEYHSFNTAGGSDGIIQEVRWPYWAESTYNAIYSQTLSSSDGGSCYFYGGMPSGPSSVPPCSIIWSFWPPGGTAVPGAAVTAYWTATNMYAPPHVGEGASGKAAGPWPLIQSNQWYREVFRVWQPADGTPHQAYVGRWLRDSATGNWYHLATMSVPFSATGIDGLSGFQEDFGNGNRNPRRTDYRNVYYHRNGTWSMANQFTPESNCNGISGLIENGTASFFELCAATNYLQGIVSSPPPTTGPLILFVDPGTSAAYLLTNPPANTLVYNWKSNNSPATLTITNQPGAPALDAIVVTNYGATFSGNQVVVQWQVPATSAPQLGYMVEVFNNSSYTGAVAVTFFDCNPEARQKLLNIAGVSTPYIRLSVVDIFDRTNTPLLITPSTATLNPATSVPGAVNGLGYVYYESATSYYWESDGVNWPAMPNFGLLTPVAQGAVNNPDLTPRHRRNGYAFNYTGYISVPTDGLYTFTLNSSDGAKLFIDGVPVVNWDGVHSPGPLSGWAGLQAGAHAVNIQYFFNTQNSNAGDLIDALTVTYEGPGISSTVVPDSAWFRVPGGGEPSVTLTAPTSNAMVCGSNLTFAASVTPNGAAVSNVQFYIGNNYWGKDVTAPFNLNSFVWSAPGNPIRARLIYNSTNTIDSAPNVVTTTNMTLAPWLLSAMSEHAYPNGGRLVGGTYTLIGDGLNLMGRAVAGDCTLIAHLSGIIGTAAGPDGQAPNAGWSAGIMLRGNTNSTPGTPLGNSSSRYACVFSTVGNGTYYEDDTMSNGGGPFASGNLGSYAWYKIQRISDTFTTSVSSDGVTWTAVNTNTLSGIGTTIYVGPFTYAASSQNPNVHWASFDSVSLTGNVVGPPTVTITPQTDTAYTGQSSTFTALAGGAAPFSYQWQFNGVNLTGATNVALPLTNLQPTNSGLYTVVLTNANGSATGTATLTVLTPPPAVAQILANAPLAYLRLNETAGPTACDSAGNYNGTGQGRVLFGVAGVTNAPFTGFENGNLGAQFNGDASPSDIAITPFNVTTTRFTITGWVKCNGTQDSWSGLAFSRGSGHGVGLMVVNNGGNELRYSWNDNGNDYNASTGLRLPSGQWAFVALAISPTSAVVYLATNATLRSWTNTTANIAQTFAGSFYLGCDPNSLLSNSRQFNGTLDEFAFYNRTLTGAQLGQILSASQTAAPGVTLTAPANGANFGAPATISLAASVVTNGHTLNSVQFYSGATLLGSSSNAPYSLTWSNVAAGTYTLLAQATYDTTNTQSSAPALVTVNNAPTTPQNLSVVAVASSEISLSWSAVANATGYIINRDGTLVATTAGPGWLDTSLAANTAYAYSVIATNPWGTSPPSATNSATTLSGGTGLAWDAGGLAAGATDGSGNWGSSGTNWWNGSAVVAWTDNSIATFGAGSGGGNTVTLTNDVTPAGIAFAALNGAYTLAGGGGGINLSGTMTVNSAVDGTVGAVVKGSGKLLKTGAGTLTLSGVNTYTGSTTISNGTLTIGGSGQLGSGTYVGAITNNGTLNFAGSANQTLSGVISGSGVLVQSGSSTLTIWGTSSFNGGTTVNNGTLFLQAAVRPASGSYSPLGTGPIAISGGTLQVNPGNGGGNSYTFANAVTLNGGTFYQNDGVNHFTGLLTVNGGSGASLIKANYSGKDLYLDGGMAGAGAVKITSLNGGYGAGLVHVTANGTYGGTITVDNSGGLNGGLFVKANNVLQNATVDLETTASTDSGNPVGLTIAGSASNVTLAGLTGAKASSYVHNGDATARTLTINVSPGNTNLFAGQLGDGTANGNNFALVKTDAGTLLLAGTNTFVGPTTISNGTLLVNGSLSTNTVVVATNGVLGGIGRLAGRVTLQDGATLIAGTNFTVGALTISNTLTLSPRSTNYMRVTRTGGQAANDLVQGISSTLTYAGTLVVSDITSDTNTLRAGDSFKLFSAAGYGGTFSNFILPSLATNLGWNTSTLNNNGTISVGFIPVITNQPQSLAVNLGSPASFTVGATSAGTLVYQWQKDGTNLAGAVTSSFNIASVAATDVGNYTVIVANNFGSVTSLTARLVVNLPPVISGLNWSGTNGFSLTATGAPGETCVLLGASNLTPPIAWSALMTNTANANAVFNFSDPQATNFPARYYRLVAQ